MRRAIVAAAVACDYEALDALLVGGRRFASFSFGGAADAGDYWREIEEEAGEPVLELLVRTLDLPHITDRAQADEGGPRETFYVWPSAHQESPTEQDWELVTPLYGEEAIAQMRRIGSGFLGYRIGIVEDGDWVYFIAGD